MRGPLRQSVKFHLSVEGETERWYFERLRDLINASPLSGIALEDVAAAVERAKRMNEVTMGRGARTAEHCGFGYCLDNPYTELPQLVGEILAKTRALPGIAKCLR